VRFQVMAYDYDAVGQCRAVQVDPMKPDLKPHGIKSLKLKWDTLLSTSAFRFNLRRYDADKMTFRMGTPHEYGGMKRSKRSVVPFAVDPATGKTVVQAGPARHCPLCWATLC
jgi:hypothetical protein